MNVYTQWKKYLENNQPSAVDMAAYAIARSLTSDQPLQKALVLLHAGFPPIKSKTRLLNGEYPYSNLANIIGYNSNFKWQSDWQHRRIKARLLEIFAIEDSDELTAFLADLTKNIDHKHSTPYSYVIVRKDLEPAQRVVQSCHAIQEVTMENPEAHKNTHMIVLQVPSEAELKQVETVLSRFRRVIKFHTFHEPDNNTGFTAIATSPIVNRYLRNFFANYELLVD